MKKVAFVSTGFTGSILPLADELLKRGYQVDLYLITFYSQKANEHEAFEIAKDKYRHGINTIEQSKIKGIEWMKKKERFRFFLVCNYGNAINSIFLIRRVAVLLQYMVLRNVVKRISTEKYDIINVVGHDLFISRISLALCSQNVVHTFHEVYNHSSQDKSLLKSVVNIMESHIPVIVPSKHLKNFIKKFDATYNVERIPLGLFIGYRSFEKRETCIDLPSRYILFLGNILPYKGLEFLYNTCEYIKRQGKQIHVVIAGNGYLEILDAMKRDDCFTIINRWITNSELVALVKSSVGLVCPYLSASQSGLPLTGYAFKKPVVVTDVGAMSEYVIEGETGFIVPVNDKEKLAEQMLALYENTPGIDFKNMENVIAQLNIDWKILADQYLNYITETFRR